MNFSILMSILWVLMLIVNIIIKEDIEYILHIGLWTLASFFNIAKSFVNTPIVSISYFVFLVLGAAIVYMWCRRSKYVGEESERKFAILFAVLDVFFVLIYIGKFLVSII